MNGPKVAVDNLASLRELHGKLDKLPPSGQAFAQSLFAFYRKHNKLTEKQWPYVHKMLAEIAEREKPKDAPDAFEISGFAGIEEKLQAQRARGVQFPAIRLHYMTQTKEPSVLKVYPSVGGAGCGAHLDGFKVGTVVREKFRRTDRANLATEVEKKIVELLIQLVADPVLAAKEYAKATSACCFCGIALRNASSVYHGYGPICADNFGLPWGDVPEAEFDAEGAMQDLGGAP